MTVETLLIVFAFVITMSMAFQAFFLWRLAMSTQNLIDRLDGVSHELETDFRDVVDQLRGVAGSVEHLKHLAEGVESRANELDQMFGERVKDIDQLVGRLVEVGSRQADKVDSVISDTVGKFEETTAVIQQDIVRPVVEISSLVKGLKTGLDYLFSKKRVGSEEAYPEDQLFI